jgi:hypothetical protein
MNGQVAGDLTYNNWLKSQSAEAQDHVLGKAKGKLFRQGGMSMDKFVDTTGHIYTLEELRRKDKALFTRLGI